MELQCPKCGSTNVTVMPAKTSNPKPKDVWGWVIWILFVVCTLGLVLLQPLLTNTGKQKAQAICQVCGHVWEVECPKQQSSDT